MHQQARQVSIRVPLDRLNVCRICGELHGVVVRCEAGGAADVPPPRELHQRCGCASPTPEHCWAGYDFNQAVALCRCCGRRLLMSGMRWSEWFCGDCLPMIEVLNVRCRRSVIPASRQTLYAGIAEMEQAGGTKQSVADANLGDWFDRVELLERHARQVVHDNLLALGLDTLESDVTSAEYLAGLPASRAVCQASVRSLAGVFLVPRQYLVDLA